MSPNQRIIREKQLRAEAIHALLADEALALVVEGYYPESLCTELSGRILGSGLLEHYTHEEARDGAVVQKYYGVDRLGVPFNFTYGAETRAETSAIYYQEAARGIARLRELASPAATPIDKLRLELDEIFLPGATVAAFEGRKMLAGIGRITKSALSHLSAEQPHFDALPERFARLDEQLAANVYLKVPDEGGELEVWDVPPVDPLSAVPADWRASLPASVSIRPRTGDLVIFNCRRPHAISSFNGEDRVTVQMFIGYRKGEPLLLWN